jgi:hypothetical protein
MIKIPSLKTIGIIVIILILIYAWGVTQYAIKQKEEKEIAQTERDQAVAIATQQKEETTFYMNAYNEQVAKVKSTEISLDNVNRLIETKDFEWLKKFNSLKKKYQNLEQASNINISFRGDSLVKTVVYLPCEDTVELFRYYIHDEFNHIDAVVLDTPVFEIKAPIYIANFWERKKFLGLRIGKKEYFLEVTTPNDLISIDSLVHYTTGRRRK